MNDLMLLAALSADVLHWLIAVWLFAFGGVIGSFLNVVIHRLPAGMSLVEPGSHCPACKHPIRWFDNVPIFGWIILRGRCRDCRARISPRYPIVEAITASLFLVLGVVELLGDRANLPLRAVKLPDDVILPSRTLAEQYGIYSFHLLLLCTLLVAVLIEHDGYRPPWRLFVPAIIAGVCAPLIWPGLRPVSAVAGPDGWMAGLADGAAGLAAGAVLGPLTWLVLGTREQTGIVPASACVGLFLGWQAAAVLIVVTAVIHLPVWAVSRALPGVRRIPPNSWLALGSLGWILGWAPLVDRFPVLG